MMKVLVTGATGFIGRNLVERWEGRYSLCAPTSAELDLTDAMAVREYLARNRFDVIVHAATTRSNRKLKAPMDLVERNCRMFVNLARNESLFGRMFCYGSGAEYGRETMPPRVREEYFDTSVPSDAYGFSKYICGKYAEHSEKICNLRIFGVYGKYEAWDVRFISNACCRVLHGLPIVMRQNVSFDYLHVDDLANLTCWFIEHDAKHRAYNVCSGHSIDLLTLAEIVAQVSGRNPEIVVLKGGMGSEYSGDNSRMLRETGRYDFLPFEDGVAELYRWYEQHRSAIDSSELEFDGTYAPRKLPSRKAAI